jgi:hypothetical protein
MQMKVYITPRLLQMKVLKMSKSEFIDAVLFALFIIVPFVIYWS